MKRTHKIAASLAMLTISAACGNSAEMSSQGKDDPSSVAETVFAAKCAMCHDFKENRIGPALDGVHQRWDNDVTRLKAFIRNSQEVIQSGDPYAVALYEKWNKSAMPAFPGLTDAELEALVAYLK